MGETNVELEILPMCGQWSVMAIGRPCALSFRDLYANVGNLEPSCKFQRASRPKKEDRRDPTHCHEEGCFSFFGFFIDAKNGKSLLLLCHYARFRVCSCSNSYWPMYIPAQRYNYHGQTRFFIIIISVANK